MRWTMVCAFFCIELFSFLENLPVRLGFKPRGTYTTHHVQFCTTHVHSMTTTATATTAPTTPPPGKPFSSSEPARREGMGGGRRGERAAARNTQATAQNRQRQAHTHTHTKRKHTHHTHANTQAHPLPPHSTERQNGTTGENSIHKIRPTPRIESGATFSFSRLKHSSIATVCVNMFFLMANSAWPPTTPTCGPYSQSRWRLNAACVHCGACKHERMHTYVCACACVCTHMIRACMYLCAHVPME